MIFVVSASSGTGKTTVLNILQKKYHLPRLITYTTRPPRRDEKNSQDYYFCTEPKFKRLASSGKLAEWAPVYGFWYGTPREELEKERKRGNPVILALDTQGAFQIKARYPEETVLIALLPPSRQELEKRIRNRQKESGETSEMIAKRLTDFQKEMEIFRRYDYQLVNNKVEKTADALYRIIQRVEKKSGNFLSGAAPKDGCISE